MSFDFTAWKGPRSITQIQADHAAQDARDRLAEEARKAAKETAVHTDAPARKAA